MVAPYGGRTAWLVVCGVRDGSKPCFVHDCDRRKEYPMVAEADLRLEEHRAGLVANSRREQGEKSKSHRSG